MSKPLRASHLSHVLNPDSTLSRGEFFRVALGGAAAGLLLAACGSNASPGPDARANADGNPTPDAPQGTPDAAAPVDAAPASCADGTVSTIGGNHGHTLVVSAADIEAAVDKTYAIQGASAHDHDVTLTAAHFATLATGQAITVTSSSSGHTHTITVTC